MKRRKFITLLGAAAAWPLAARAQQPDRLRRIGVLMYLPADNPDATRRVDALLKGLHELGWTDGRNVQIDMRWGVVDAARSRRYAAELVSLAPDVILVASSAPVGALLEATRTIPVVFVNVSDPVGAGFVASLARPGGNATGFAFADYTMAGNGRSCSKRSCHVRRGWRSCVIRPCRSASASSASSSLRRRP